MISADVSKTVANTRARLELTNTKQGRIASWELDDSWGRYFSWWGHLDEPIDSGEFALTLHVTEGSATWTLDQSASPCISIAPAEQPGFVLRRELEINRPVRSATLYATGLGYHRLVLNGKAIQAAVLDPAVTDYDQRVLYNRHDIDTLVPGRNVLEIELGHGYFSTVGANIWGWHAAPWTQDPIAIAELEVSFIDGDHLIVGTDEQWTVHPSPIVRDALYEGEVWRLHNDQDSSAPTTHACVRLAPSGALRIQSQPRIIPRPVTSTPRVLAESPSEYLIDIGCTIAGWIELTCSARAGTEVEITYGELLEDVRVGVRNPFIDGRPQVDRIQVGVDGQIADWVPRFTYKGFRFVRVRGSALRIDSLRAVEVHSDIEAAGSFASGSELVNWIDAATQRTLLNNLHGIPTDTPVHEKNGWTGDGHLIARTAMYQFDMERFYRKWLHDFRDAQEKTGAVPVIVPSPGWGRIVCPVFSGAYPILTWDHFLHYGDERVLRENLDGVVAYSRYLITQLASTGTWEGYSWGDWMSPGYDYAPEGPTLAATAFCLESIRRTEWISHALGEPALSQEMSASFNAFRDAFNNRFYDATGSRYRTAAGEEYRQGSSVLALAFDLVPEHARAEVVQRLVDDITLTRGNHLNTGAPATRYLLPVLSNAGRDDVAVSLLLQTTPPSWGFWYKQGGDTLWEKWSPEARSRNHYFFGTVSQWIRERIGGLAIEHPGGSLLVFDPLIDDRIRSGACSVMTVNGTASVDWRLEGKRVFASFDVPVGVSIRMADRLRSASPVPLEAGRHSVELQYSRAQPKQPEAPAYGSHIARKEKYK